MEILDNQVNHRAHGPMRSELKRSTANQDAPFRVVSIVAAVDSYTGKTGNVQDFGQDFLKWLLYDRTNLYVPAGIAVRPCTFGPAHPSSSVYRNTSPPSCCRYSRPGVLLAVDASRNAIKVHTDL